MSTLQTDSHGHALDKHGYLVTFDEWTPELAEEWAGEEGLELTDCHWKVIRFMREYYSENEMPPSPKVIIRTIGEQVSQYVPCTRKRLEGLFPQGGCKQACRLAGLPRAYCHSC